MSVESNWKNRSGRRAKMETKKERKKKKEEREKTWRFRKELKMFLRDILLIEPLRLCPTPTLLPFHPSSIRSLSLSCTFSARHLSRSHTPRCSPLLTPSTCISIHVCLFYSRLLYLYPFLSVYVSPLLRQQSTWIGRLLLTWKKKKNNQKSQKKKETPGETRRYKEERKRRIHIDGITVKMFRKGCWAIAKRIHQTIFRQH